MRTVHEPEPPRASTTANASASEPTPPGKKSGIKLKLSNGNTNNPNANLQNAPPTPTHSAMLAPTHDEDGNPVTPSLPTDNIQYIPAHHPITGQPGFMITYPPDIHFSAWESSIQADELLRLLRRQVHWAEQESEELKAEVERLERLRREEWVLKELLLDGALEEGFERAKVEGWLDDAPGVVRRLMEADAEPSRRQKWAHGTPSWRKEGQSARPGHNVSDEHDTEMVDATATPSAQPSAQRTPSPPPTGHSGGGFDGDADPYDNYLAGRMAEYYERERLRSLQSTPQKQRQEQKEADAVGALVGLSGK
jgi:hypothetical protein